MAIALERLSNEHNRDAFDCGTPELNAYLHKQAGQDAKRNLSRVFVLIDDEKQEIIGFFTLSQYALKPVTIPERLKKKLPANRDVPCTLLGRLAVSVNYRGMGYGRALLFHAVWLTAAINENIASVGLVVDAKDQSAKDFYEKFGFSAFPSNAMRMLMTIKEIQIFINAWEEDDRNNEIPNAATQEAIREGRAGKGHTVNSIREILDD